MPATRKMTVGNARAAAVRSNSSVSTSTCAVSAAGSTGLASVTVEPSFCAYTLVLLV